VKTIIGGNTMVFEKTFENSYHELSQETKYRFAEIEMYYAIDPLMEIFRQHPQPRDRAVSTIFQTCAPRNLQIDEVEVILFRALSHKPPKNEVIQYLLLKGHSYTKIRNITNASPNSIASLRFGLPTHFPRFNRWDEEMLHKWNNMKKAINIFNDELTQTKG
jgi:hypothetical protein